jgi:hypothetical protein
VDEGEEETAAVNAGSSGTAEEASDDELVE